MNEELNIEKLTDLAIYYPEYLVDAAVKAFGNDSQKLETIAVVVSGLNDLGMPLNAMFFLQVLSRMLNLEVELPTALIREPYLCAWFVGEFTYWLLQYVDDYCEFSLDEWAL